MAFYAIAAKGGFGGYFRNVPICKGAVSRERAVRIGVREDGATARFPTQLRRKDTALRSHRLKPCTCVGRSCRRPERIYPGSVSIRPVTGMECTRPARLEDRQLDEIRGLEERLGIVLVGYERLPRYRQLSPGELDRLRSIEREIGSVLVAYEATPR